MKDKRQRMAVAWPYGIPPDPHLYAYLAAAAASYPYGVMGGTGLFPGELGAGDSPGQPLAASFAGPASGVSSFMRSGSGGGGGIPTPHGIPPHQLGSIGHTFSSLHGPSSLVPPAGNTPVRPTTSSPGNFVPSGYLGSQNTPANESGRMGATPNRLGPAYGLGGHASPHLHQGFPALGNFSLGNHGTGLNTQIPASSPSLPGTLSSHHPLFRSPLDLTAMSQLLAVRASSLQYQHQQQHHHHHPHLPAPRNLITSLDSARLAALAAGSRIPFGTQVSPPYNLPQTKPIDERGSPQSMKTLKNEHNTKLEPSKASPDRSDLDLSPVQPPHSTRPDSTGKTCTPDDTIKVKPASYISNPPKGLFRPFQTEVENS